MKTTLFLLFMALSTHLQAQCGFDSIGSGSSGVASVDSSVIGVDIAPQCAECAADGCTAWQLPADTALHISLFAGSVSRFSIQITTECSLVLWDTCVTLSPNPSTPFTIGAILPPYSQIIVCGDIGDTVVLMVKATPPMNFPSHTAPYIDLTTCTTPVGMAQPIEQSNRYWEFDGYYWREVQEMRPNRLYKVK
jgi:hypothetical protein